METLKEKAKGLGSVPGVYIMKDKSENIIYIGKAKNLKNRVSSYFRTSADHGEKVRKMVSHVADFDYIVTKSEFEALILECSLIKQHYPKYNIKLKDDKGCYYIKISDIEFPRITAERKNIGGGKYIGPFLNSFTVKETVENANTVFKLPRCNRRFPQEFRKGRTCLYYHIKKCSGICKGNISQEDYNLLIKQAINYMKTGSDKIFETLTKEMEEAAENLEFEKAAVLRDRINAVKKASETQKVFLNKQHNIDAISAAKTEDIICIVVINFRGGKLVDKKHYIFENIEDFDTTRSEFYFRYYSECSDLPKQIYFDEEPKEQDLLKQLLDKMANSNITLTVPQKGEGYSLVKMAEENAVEQLAHKMSRSSREIKALDELAKILNIKPPKIIEAYDVSNLGDSGIVGAMVVFNQGKPQKSSYKKFSINTVSAQDDYGAMTEMLERRFNRYMDESKNNEGFGIKPELILIDGGKGHVTAVKSVIDKFGLDISVFGMVKNKKHRTKAIASDGGEIEISGFKYAFNLITQIQDETHRFTIAYQRKKRKLSGLEQKLLEIDGIGKKKAAALTLHYKTRAKMLQSDSKTIAKIAHISIEKANEVLGNFTQTS